MKRPATATPRASRRSGNGENAHSKRFARLPKRPSPRSSVSRRSGGRSKPLSTMPPRPFTVSTRVRYGAIAGPFSSATSPGGSPPMSIMATWKSSTAPSLICANGTPKSRNPSSLHAIRSSNTRNLPARYGKSSRNGQAVKIVRFPSTAARWSTTSRKTDCNSSSARFLTVICEPSSSERPSSGHLATKRGNDNSHRMP